MESDNVGDHDDIVNEEAWAAFLNDEETSVCNDKTAWNSETGQCITLSDHDDDVEESDHDDEDRDQVLEGESDDSEGKEEEDQSDAIVEESESDSDHEDRGDIEHVDDDDDDDTGNGDGDESEDDESVNVRNTSVRRSKTSRYPQSTVSSASTALCGRKRKRPRDSRPLQHYRGIIAAKSHTLQVHVRSVASIDDRSMRTKDGVFDDDEVDSLLNVANQWRRCKSIYPISDSSYRRHEREWKERLRLDIPVRPSRPMGLSLETDSQWFDELREVLCTAFVEMCPLCPQTNDQALLVAIIIGTYSIGRFHELVLRLRHFIPTDQFKEDTRVLFHTKTLLDARTEFIRTLRVLTKTTQATHTFISVFLLFER